MNETLFETVLNFLIPLFVVLVFLVWFLVCFAFIPRGLWVQKQCLEAGYPESKVTWDYKGYCLTIDGAVQAKVDELK